MDRDRLLAFLGALTEAEFAQLSTDARELRQPTAAEQLRAAEAAGDWDTAFAIKAAHLGALMNNTHPDPNPKG
jgi:hypothetical protein